MTNSNSIGLTGVKPTGKLHLGNYIGAIKPIVDILKEKDNIDIYFFIADQHALTSQPQPSELNENIREMMVALHAIFSIAGENDKNRIFLYRQSHVPAIFEYYWMLSCFTAKGFLNRNHSYKQLTEENIENDKDVDKGIFAGLFNYPVLMASDILIFNTDWVPVGKDQLQHIGIANDIGAKLNYIYKTEHFKYCNVITNFSKNPTTTDVLLPGKDGRKMSKSYNNEVRVFGDEEDLKNYIYKIKTNFKMEGEPKYPSESLISDIYRKFTENDSFSYEHFVKLMESGAGWKELKDIVYERIIDEFKEYRNQYKFLNEKFFFVKKRFEQDEMYINAVANKRLNEFKIICGMEGE